MEKNKNHLIVYTLKKESTNGEKPLADWIFGGDGEIRPTKTFRRHARGLFDRPPEGQNFS